MGKPAARRGRKAMDPEGRIRGLSDRQVAEE